MALFSGTSPLILAEIAPSLREWTDLFLIGNVILGVDVDIGSPEFAHWEILLLDNGDTVHGIVDPALPLITVLGSAPPLMLGIVTPGLARALLADLEPFL